MITFEWNDLWPRYLACWFSFTLGQSLWSRSQVKVQGQKNSAVCMLRGKTMAQSAEKQTQIGNCKYVTKWSVRPAVRAFLVCLDNLLPFFLRLQDCAVMILCCRLTLTSHIFLQTRCRHTNRKKADCSCVHLFLLERIQMSLCVNWEDDSKMYVRVKCLLDYRCCVFIILPYRSHVRQLKQYSKC